MKISKLFLIIVIVSVIMMMGLGIFVIAMSDNWLVGRGCLYDNGGFIEMKHGEEIKYESGVVIRCNNGTVVFE